MANSYLSLFAEDESWQIPFEIRMKSKVNVAL
jgi:hypothetical protein